MTVVEACDFVSRVCSLALSAAGKELEARALHASRNDGCTHPLALALLFFFSPWPAAGAGAASGALAFSAA